MCPGPKQGGMAGDVFWPKEGYEVCMLSLRMRENGCLYCRASMPPVLAILIFIYLRNFIIRCEEGACMAMQKKTWMTGILFNEWINHFLHHVGQMYDISNENRHFLIVDGHNSHVTLDVAHTARKVGLDLLTISSHTSHATQPLDVSIFKLFKMAFRKYWNFWILRNKGKGATKEDLAQWVSLALKKVMTPANIQKRFIVTGIWLLNWTALNDKMGLIEVFIDALDVVNEEEVGDEHV